MFLLVRGVSLVPELAGVFAQFQNYLCIFKICASCQRDIKRVKEQHKKKLSSSLLFLSFLLLLISYVHCSANWLKAELFVKD